MEIRDLIPRDVIPIPFDEIPKTDGQVLLDFTLSYELIDEDGEYLVSLHGHQAEISVHKEPATEHFKNVSREHLVIRGSPTIIDDTRGFSVVSRIKMKIEFVTKPEYFLQIALEYLNRVLDVWRFATKKFWLKESVSDRDILAMMYKIIPASGESQEGCFGFGLPGAIKFPYTIIETSKALPIILKCLKDETAIPLFQMFLLNALNHLIERRFDLSIIEMNIALEEYATIHLGRKLLQKGCPEGEISKRLSKYDRLHKKLDRGFKDIAGVSLKDDKELWNAFNLMRDIRKNTVHPFVRRMSYQDAMNVTAISNKIAAWIAKH
jgi:hypothetical protein